MKLAARIIGIAIGILYISSPASAVPGLQLYMPDATYYESSPWVPSEDTWITNSNPFELQVVGATTPNWVHYIDNIELYVSMRESEYLLFQSLADPILTIQDIDPNISLARSIYASDFILGMPDGLTPHGMYPTYYASIGLPTLLVETAGETVYDFDKDFDPNDPGASGHDSGDIQHYLVNYFTSIQYLHFDVTGIAHNGHSKFVKNPYSHDADSLPVPEPSSMALLGSGLLGLIFTGIRRRRDAA
ncbi:MAG: choice-of-anchor N protein [Candidatus Omnitrophota bacterium]